MSKKLFRSLFALLLTAFLVCGMLPSAIMTATAADHGQKLISAASPAIPASVGETVTLFDYGIMTKESKELKASDITWKSSEITIQNGAVTPTKKGVYPLTATAKGTSVTIYLVVKEASETEYVLYEQDFDTSSSLSDLGYDVIEQTNDACTAVIKNGKLVLSAQSHANNYVRVLLPAWLGEFGDYRIEANAAMTATEGASRWMSFMFRIQNNTQPYHQFAVRANATASSGTEIAFRTASNTWDVMHKTAYTKNLTDKAYRTFTIDACGDTVSTSIDDHLLVRADNIWQYDYGRIGLQARACEMSLDSIRVTLRTDSVAERGPYMAEVRNPDSNLVLPPTIVTEINTAAKMNALKEAIASPSATIPATAIFRVNDDLEVLAADGSVISTVEEIIEALERTVIPAFRVEDTGTATAVGAWLKTNAILDAFVVSSDAEAVKKARETYEMCRGILDFSDKINLTDDNLSEIRESTNACGARICILPASFAERDRVEHLQRLFMTVWIENDSASVSSIVSSVTTGANGIVTRDAVLLASTYTKYFEKNTVLRPSGFIGHRGIPSLAQENSLAGAVLAYELGATAIENDIHLSKDGVIVVMHDATIDRTTNGTGRVSDMTYAELQEYTIDSLASVDPEPIPTLADYFRTFKGKDVQIVVEIKTSDNAICASLVALCDEYDILDQVNVISFHTSILEKLKELRPEISVGYLTSALADDENDPTASVEQILRFVQTYDSTYNPSYSSGKLGPNLLLAVSHRGITVWPYTINDKSSLSTYMRYGTYGITTNYTQDISDCVKRVSTDSSAYFVDSPSEEIPVTVTATTYARKTSETTDVELVLIEGNDIFTYENGKLTASGEGAATLMFSFCASTPIGRPYYLCTEPFRIEIGGESVEETETQTEVCPPSTDTDSGAESESPTETDPLDTDRPEETTDALDSSGCTGTIVAPAALTLSAILCAALPLLRKRDRRA